jgi:hypothetical protein
MTDLSQLDATAQAELVRKGDVSPRTLGVETWFASQLETARPWAGRRPPVHV